jgi:hypothetical protein
MYTSVDDFFHPNPPTATATAPAGGTGGTGGGRGKGRDGGSPGRVHTRDASPPAGRGRQGSEGARRDKHKSPPRMSALEAAAAAVANNPLMLSVSGNVNVGGRTSPLPPASQAPGEKKGAARK